MDKKIIFILGLILPLKQIVSHTEYVPRPSFHKDLSSGNRESDLGYGTFGKSSDAAAQAMLKPRCDEQRLKENIECAGVELAPTIKKSGGQDFLKDLKQISFKEIEKDLLENIKKKIYERSLLELAANGGKLGDKLPQCLKKDLNSNLIKYLAEDLRKNPSSMDSSKFLKNPTVGNLEKLEEGSIDRQFVNRYQGVANNTDHSNIIASIILGEQLKSKHIGNVYKTKGYGFLWLKTKSYQKFYSKFGTDDCKSEECKINQARYIDMANRNQAVTDGSSQKEALKIKDHLEEIMRQTVYKDTIYAHKGKIDEGFSLIHHYSESRRKSDRAKSIISDFSKHLFDAKKLAQKLPPNATKSQKMMAKAFKGIEKQLKKVRKARNKDLQKKIKCLCNFEKSKPSDSTLIDFLLKNYQLELNQAIIDMKDQSKVAALQLLICSRSKDQNNPSLGTICDKVTKIGKDKIVVSGKDFGKTNTSLSSKLDYTIKKGSPNEVEMSLSFSKSDDLSDQEFQEFKKRQEENINNFYNCGAGSISSYVDIEGNKIECPKVTPPRVKFNIKIQDNSDLDFKVHKCFRAETYETDCDKVKQYKINKCKKSLTATSSGQTLSDIFPGRKKFYNIDGEGKRSIYMQKSLECISKAKEDRRCLGLSGCRLTTCTAEACAIYPPEENACISKKILDFVCSKKTRSFDDLIKNPVPINPPPSPPADSKKWSRANAENITFNTSDRTILHEIGHRIGMDDEYYDSVYYPVPNLGEKDSIMRAGKTIMPRHIDTVLRPLQCLDSK